MAEIRENEAVNGSNGQNAEPWERAVLEKLILAHVAEQRRARRWGIFFKSLFFLYLVALFVVMVAPFSPPSGSASKRHTAVVDVSGIIAEGTDTNADAIIEGLRAAVKDEGTQGIILHVNSPGGSPVQSAYVYDEVRRIKQAKPHLPIYAVVSDICASGGYYIASAADAIYANPASIVGSIGVIMNGFGFVEAMQKMGIERRLLIAGEHKAILDPFSPVSSEEKAHVQRLLDQVHQQFIEAVRTGRGDRLKNDPALFSGLVWTGQEGLELGLVDAIGNLHSVAKGVIGAEQIVNFTPQEKFYDRFIRKIGAAFGRMLWSAALENSIQLQ